MRKTCKSIIIHCFSEAKQVKESKEVMKVREQQQLPEFIFSGFIWIYFEKFLCITKYVLLYISNVSEGETQSEGADDNVAMDITEGATKS